MQRMGITAESFLSIPHDAKFDMYVDPDVPNCFSKSGSKAGIEEHND